MQIAPWVFPLTEETASVPPHVRRKASTVRFHTDRAGITPACAGKSAACSVSCIKLRDHPRACGEKSSTCATISVKTGSPPRVRGKAFGQLAGLVKGGITPACAGKSATSCRCRGSAWDHPRVCGEKAMGMYTAVLPLGSPPRVRGKGSDRQPASSHPRITPACAGKSSQWDSVYEWRWDHPRVCGEKHFLHPAQLPNQGSPPRVRGKVSLVFGCVGFSGITPACAGKSSTRRDMRGCT